MLAERFDGTVPICAVEIGEFQRKVLRKRFPTLPIWDDVRTFSSDNPECASAFDRFRGVSDELVLCGGFPCQDISCAGKGKGICGERSGLWKEFARIAREIRPRFVFVENSPFIVSRGLGEVLGDMAAMGYDGAWGVLSAASLGYRHIRERFWGLFVRR